MNLVSEQIKAVKEVLLRHEKYHHFSGLACVIVGVLWLLNHYVFVPNLMGSEGFSHAVVLLSWVTVAAVSILIGAALTIRERQKRGKMIATLSLRRIIYKLAVISIATLALLWIFYQAHLEPLVPALFMLMYGLLMLTSKDNLPVPIQYFGYLSFVAGVLALVQFSYITTLHLVVLGLGHIVLGITLMIHEK